MLGFGSLSNSIGEILKGQGPSENEPALEGFGEAVSPESQSSGEGAVEQEPAKAPSENSNGTDKKRAAFKSVDGYSLKLEGGFGWRNFQNGQKLDHDGGMFRVAAGLRIPIRKRLTLSPRLAYEFQGLRKDLGFDVVSRAKAHMIGIELDVGIAAHPKWFSIHPILGIGAAIYRAPGNQSGTVGVEFNKNPLLFPIRESGARVELGLQICTWGDAICFGARFAGDMGINPAIDVVDGDNPAMGLNPMGASVSAGVDVLRVVSNLRNRKNSKADPVESRPSNSTEALGADEFPPTESSESSVAETEGKDGPPVLPAHTAADFEASLEEARKHHAHVAGNLKNSQNSVEKIKNPKTKKSDKKIIANSAAAFFRSSFERTQSVEVILAGISDAYGKMNDPVESEKVFAILTEIEGLYREMASDTLAIHGIAEESVEAYNKRRGSEAEVTFVEPRPEYPKLNQE